MRTSILAAAMIIGLAIASVSNATASHGVRGHFKKNGTYVAPTRATNPNKTKRDNYSHQGNVNPANGKAGKRK
jgi:hypothetical protein